VEGGAGARESKGIGEDFVYAQSLQRVQVTMCARGGRERESTREGDGETERKIDR